MPETPFEVVPLGTLDTDSKVRLLRELGFDSDGTYVLRGGHRHLDEATGKEILLNHMAILPGTVRVISDNPVSIADYLEDYDETLQP